jgi:hypothetical protein
MRRRDDKTVAFAFDNKTPSFSYCHNCAFSLTENHGKSPLQSVMWC